MGKDPERIRQEIEETRSEMGETVEAIGYKTNVKARVKHSVSEKKDAVTGAVSSARDAVVGTADQAVSRVTGAVPDRREVEQGARRGAAMAKQNPLGLAVGSAAVGFLIGLLSPPTRMEDERMGSLADELKDRAADTGTEAVERGKVVAEEAVTAVGETVKETAREQGQELASSAKENAEDVASSARSRTSS
jgi:gas vesicle protein